VAAVRHSEAVVVGGGAAGLAAALAMAPRRVTLLSKARFGEGGSTAWAQGGVAAAMGRDDSPALHAADTLAVGGGLGDPAVVALLTAEGPRRIEELLALGTRFDRRSSDGSLALGREAAHGRRRVLHAGGDATGAELMRSLSAAVAAAAHVTVAEESFAVDLALETGADGKARRVVGVLAVDRDGRRVLHLAAAVVLATGGLGQLYRYTTNPVEVTGDGLAMAARAGARLVDVEFVQFHPTALAAGEAEGPLPLLTEALRGEGALLVNGGGRRFMVDEHPDAELAPRDVVARAIQRRRDAGDAVHLDARAVVGEGFPQRFPTVFAKAAAAGLDPRRDLLPVTPAAHYHMGGVAVDERGRSSLAGLWACGETACTGVHGANRLASNSLLEALVFGARVADDVTRRVAGLPGAGDAYLRRVRVGGRGVELSRENEPVGTGPVGLSAPGTGGLAERLRALRLRLRKAAWTGLGLVRDAAGLERSRAALEEVEGELVTLAPVAETAPWAEQVAYHEARNLALAGRLVATAALARPESRGAHARSDHAAENPVWRRRLVLTVGSAGIAVDAGEPEAEGAAKARLRPAAGPEAVR
jgi:L-aspartate oxidase